MTKIIKTCLIQSPYEFLYICSPHRLHISSGNASILLCVDSVETFPASHTWLWQLQPQQQNNCFALSFERALDYSYCSLVPPSSVHTYIGLKPVKDIAFFLILLPLSSQTRRERKAKKTKIILYHKNVMKN